MTVEAIVVLGSSEATTPANCFQRRLCFGDFMPNHDEIVDRVFILQNVGVGTLPQAVSTGRFFVARTLRLCTSTSTMKSGVLVALKENTSEGFVIEAPEIFTKINLLTKPPLPWEWPPGSKADACAPPR